MTIFWFRRDLRLEDNKALFNALQSDGKVLPIFIYDKEILAELKNDDARVSFIYNQLDNINQTLIRFGCSLKIYHSSVNDAWHKVLEEFDVKKVFFNEDFEPYAIKRDNSVKSHLDKKNIKVETYTDHIIFHPQEILKENREPYTVYTPFKKKWFQKFESLQLNQAFENNYNNLYQCNFKFPSLNEIGFLASKIKVQDYDISNLENYKEKRDYPAIGGTSNLSPHLRFGTVSIREIIKHLNYDKSHVFISELVWREFFIQILYHFPRVVTENFKTKYNGIKWRNNLEEFKLWCEGKTGYPIVDAGMRQLNETGYIHNRVRMITASFLCKHLLIDWRWGEAYFASKLLDYELASNNGNWQWASGTGCDAVPYFRVFNPTTQTLKFDEDFKYIKKWVPEYKELSYQPIVEHKFARERALKAYKLGIN